MGFLTRISDGLANLASGMGTTSDRRMQSFYTLCRLDPSQIEAAYRSSWMMRKIIDIPALDMTREWRTWQAEADEISLIEAEEKRLNIRAKVKQAIVYGRLGGGAIILGIGRDNPESPVNPGALQAGSLRYAHVVSRHRLTIGEEERDPESSLYGRPKFFQLNSQARGVKIHPSRVVVFPGLSVPDLGIGAWEDHFWGDSVIQSIDEAVKHADTAQAGFASLIDECKVDSVAIPGLIDLVSTAEGEALLQKRVEVANALKSIWNTRIIDGGNGEKGTGEEWSTRQVSWAGIPDVMNAFKSFVAGAADIPETRLFGRSAAGMNATGDGDLTNYYDSIQAKQDSDLRAQLEQIDVALLPSAGVTPNGDTPNAVYFDFPPLSTPTEKEEADTFKTTMDAVEKLQNTGAIPDVAFSEALQNLMVEREWMPGLDGALKKIPEAERFEMNEEIDPNEPDPSAIAGEGGDQPVRAKIAANDAEPRTLYVSRKVVNVADLKTWAKKQGLPPLQDDLHVTLIYSRRAFDWMKVDAEDWNQEKDGTIVIPPGGVRIVEPLGDRTAVLLFTSSRLSWRHEQIVRAGAEHGYPDYQPHISLTGEPVDLSGVEPYRGKIVLGPEVFEELKG